MMSCWPAGDGSKDLSLSCCHAWYDPVELGDHDDKPMGYIRTDL